MIGRGLRQLSSLLSIELFLTKDMALSVNADMVSKGLVPTEQGTIEPSQTYKLLYVEPSSL